MFVARALELERPFLGPLCKFVALHPQQSTRRVPSYVSFILRNLADQVARTRHYNCADTLESSAEAPRVDAQACDMKTEIGGWFPWRGDNWFYLRREIAVDLHGDHGGGVAVDLCEGPKGSTGDLDSGSARSVGGSQAAVRENCREEPEPGSGLRQHSLTVAGTERL